MARMCFEKAGDVYNETWARAAELFERAELHIFTNLEKANSALQKAAELYETIRMYDKAAICYIKLGNYAKAGNDISSFDVLSCLILHMVIDRTLFKIIFFLFSVGTFCRSSN